MNQDQVMQKLAQFCDQNQALRVLVNRHSYEDYWELRFNPVGTENYFYMTSKELFQPEKESHE